MTAEIAFWTSILLTVCLAIGFLQIAWGQGAKIEALRKENIELRDRVRTLEALEEL